jgi:hypothetical protein
MTLLRVFVVVCLIAATGCSAPRAPEVLPTSTDFMKECPIYVRHEPVHGSPEPFAFIRPEHVLSIRASEPLYPGEAAMWVELTDEGASRMHRETEHAVGTPIAIYCGQTKVSTAVVVAPIKKTFRVVLPDKAGT